MYENLLERVYCRPHLIRPEKLEAIRRVVTDRAMGLRMDASAIEAAMAQNARERQPQISRSVAVVPVVGTLAKRMGMMSESSGGTSTDRLGRELDRLLADDSVGAILLDIDSPGGETFGVQELSDKIFAARGGKPIVAHANPEAASAAYYIASAADELVVTPSGWVGSVGVVAVHTDLSQLNSELGVNVTYIHAAPFKVEGNPNQPLSEESLAYYQGEVDAIYQQFVADVARNRKTSAAKVRENYGKGRMLRAEDARAAGMVDGIETMDETIVRLAKGVSLRRSKRMERKRLKLEAYK
jgi:capsid assembly protease